MDLTNALLTSNKAIENDAANQFNAGQKDQAALYASQLQNQKTSYDNNLQFNLQKAIHDSVDPVSGNIDPNKLKINGHKYGVDPQAINFALDNIAKVWETAKSVTQNKFQIERYAPGATSAVQSANTASGLSWDKQKPTSKGVANIPASGQDKPQAQSMPSMGVDENFNNIPVTGFTPGSSNASTGEITGDKYNLGSLYSGDIDQKTPDQVPGLVSTINEITPTGASKQTGSGTGTGTSSLPQYLQKTAPRSIVPSGVTDREAYFREHPQEDIEGNTIRFLRNTGYNPDVGGTGKSYETAFNNARSTIYSSIMATLPPPPGIVSNPDEQVKLDNDFNKLVSEKQQQANKAVLDFDTALNSGNYDTATNIIKQWENTIQIDGKSYRGRDAKAADTARSLVPIKTQIEPLMNDIRSTPDTNNASLGMLMARVARIYAVSRRPIVTGKQIGRAHV